MDTTAVEREGQRTMNGLHADTAKAEAIAKAAQAELARRHLLDCAQQLSPGFQPARHLRMLADLLEAVERGEMHRLIFTVHPGSGKSTLQQIFDAWYLGRNPRRKIIATSAGAELAERNSRATKALFREDAWPFETRLSEETSAMHRWNTAEGGGLVAIGTGGTITGWRADLIVCDDLQNSAGTETERESLWQWFREVLTPRLEPRGAIVIVQTRWSEDDLIGRLLEARDGDSWHVVRLPAIAEQDDPLGRAPGEALWPERFDLPELEQRKTAMGSRAFECQFQGNPVPAEGNLIKSEWLQRYDVAPRRFDRIVCALDAAAKTGIRNDFSAIVTIGVTRNAFYVLDVQRAKVEFPQLLRMAQGVFQSFTMQAETAEGTVAMRPAALYVEDTSNAIALVQALQQETSLPIVPVKATGSKESRVEGITGTLEARRVFLPNEAPWLVDFEHELLAFPGGKHDDMVDAFTMALTQVAGGTDFVFTGYEMFADEMGIARTMDAHVAAQAINRADVASNVTAILRSGVL